MTYFTIFHPNLMEKVIAWISVARLHTLFHRAGQIPPPKRMFGGISVVMVGAMNIWIDVVQCVPFALLSDRSPYRDAVALLSGHTVVSSTALLNLFAKWQMTKFSLIFKLCTKFNNVCFMKFGKPIFFWNRKYFYASPPFIINLIIFCYFTLWMWRQGHKVYFMTVEP